MATPSEGPEQSEDPSGGSTNPDAWQSLKSSPLLFSGQALEFAQVWLANIAMVVATCGVYSPWARVRTRQYFFAQTTLGGGGFDYRANPRAMVLGWLVFSVGLGLFGMFGNAITSTIASAVLPKDEAEWLAVALSIGLSLIIQLPVMCWLIVQSMRYNASRTLYRNLHFGFGSRAQFKHLWREAMTLTGLSLLVLPTLGLLWPYVTWRWRRFRTIHRRFGTTPFSFHATPADFARLHWRGLPLLLGACAAPLPAIGLLTAQGLNNTVQASLLLLLFVGIAVAFGLGLLWSCWLEAAVARLSWRSTRLGNLRFHCTWSAPELVMLRLSNALALLFSAGLAWPWVRIRGSRYRLERIAISPAGALEGFLGAEEERVSALAEGAFSLDDPLGGVLDIGF